jgi:hypothetical protein
MQTNFDQLINNHPSTHNSGIDEETKHELSSLLDDVKMQEHEPNPELPKKVEEQEK